MKLIAIILMACSLAAPAPASEDETKFVSPDGKFAMRLEKVEGQETKVSLIALPSGEVIALIGAVGRPWIDNVRMVWASDSRRMAFVRPSRRGDWTSLFVREGALFKEVQMPELPPIGVRGSPDAKTVLAARTAVRWIKPNLLLLDHEVEDDNGAGGKMRVALSFDAKNNVTAARWEK